MENKENPNPTLRIGIRVLIVIIILALLFILSLGIIKLVPKALDGIENLKSTLSSSSKSKDEVLTVTPDRTAVKTGENITISWNHTNIQNQNGYYAFKYACNNTATFATLQSNSPIACNTDFPLNASTSASQIMYSSTGEKSAIFRVQPVSGGSASPTNVMFSIDYVNPTTGGVYASGSGSLSITNENASTSGSMSSNQATTTKTVTVTPSSPTTPAAPVKYVPSGPADFQVKILSTGIIDPQTNRFVAASSFSSDEKVAIQFQISNVGGQSTGSWNFQASLPSNIAAEANYVSPVQASLTPGGSVLYTIGFDPSTGNGTQNATIRIASNSSADANQSNNSASVAINVSGQSNYAPYGNSGLSDLAITSAQPGYIASNGQFVSSTNNSAAYGSNAAINLTVTNQGGTASGNWSFSTSVQSANGYSSTASNNSGALQSLQAGASQSFVISLSQLSQGNNSVYISIDPNNQTQDANRNNNSATVQVYGNSNNSYNY